MSGELSQFYIDKARNELNEDENRKKQSMEQFRDWISKHPFIRNYRSDEVKTQQFLRVKKYSMPVVYEAIEKYALFLKSHPGLFDFNGDQLERSMKIINNGSVVMIPNRNENGERILVVRHKYINSKIFNANDMFRSLFMMIETFNCDAETQISGFIIINDYSNINFEYISLFGLKDIVDIAKLTKYVPVRTKKLFIVGLPSFATMLINQFIRTLSAKLQSRVSFFKSGQELQENHLDKSLLLEEYGGNVTDAECKLEFERKFIEHSEKIKNLYNLCDVDIKNVQETDEVGSFRKLDID